MAFKAMYVICIVLDIISAVMYAKRYLATYEKFSSVKRVADGAFVVCILTQINGAS